MICVFKEFMICWGIVKNCSLTENSVYLVVKLCGGRTRYGIRVGRGARGSSMSCGSGSTLRRS